MEIVQIFIIITSWLYLLGVCLALVYYQIMIKGKGKYHQRQRNEWNDLILTAGWEKILFNPTLTPRCLEIIISQMKMLFKSWRLKMKMEKDLMWCLDKINEYEKNSARLKFFLEEDYEKNLRRFGKIAQDHINGLKFCHSELGYESNVLQSLSEKDLFSIMNLSK